jgi:hypothetical protein
LSSYRSPDDERGPNNAAQDCTSAFHLFIAATQRLRSVKVDRDQAESRMVYRSPLSESETAIFRLATEDGHYR